MPIQIAQQDTKLSFAYAVNSVQNAMTINRNEDGNRTDGFLKATGKVVTRTVANTALSVAALVETIVKALFVVVTAGQYGPAKAQLSLAARTFVEAAKGIVQKSTPAVAEEPVKTQEPVKTDEPVKTKAGEDEPFVLDDLLYTDKYNNAKTMVVDEEFVLDDLFYPTAPKGKLERISEFFMSYVPDLPNFG